MMHRSDAREVSAWSDESKAKFTAIYGYEYWKKQWEDVCDLVQELLDH